MSTSSDERLRVCLFADSLLPDAGTEKLMTEFAKRLDPQRFEVHVCCFENSPRLEQLPSHVRKAVFPATVLYRLSGLRQVRAFHRYLASNRIQATHGFMTKSNIFVVISALRSGVRAVITSRLSTGYWYTPKLRMMYRFLNRHTTRIFTNAICAQQVTAEVEGVALDMVKVVYPGVDLVRYGAAAGDLKIAESLGIPSDARVVGIVATYRPVKDLPLFLRAAQKIANTVADAVFLLVGHGQLQVELEKLAVDLGIREKVFFSAGHGSVVDYLSRMSVACLSSQSEGLPNSILEYMAAGLPVVATDVGGISELVQDGVNGFLVKERTAEAFAAPVIRLLTDEPLRLQLAKAGLERTHREFDICAATKRLEQFYVEAVDAR
jgi:L-malate glycosyltransferase